MLSSAQWGVPYYQKWCRTGHYEIRQWQLGQWDPTIQISLVKITQYFMLLVNKTIHLLNKLHIFWDTQKRGFRIFPRNRGFGAFFDCISFYDIFSSGVHFWRRRKWLLWPKWSDWVIFTAQFFRFYRVNKASLGKTENHDKKPHRVQLRVAENHCCSFSSTSETGAFEFHEC